MIAIAKHLLTAGILLLRLLSQHTALPFHHQQTTTLTTRRHHRRQPNTDINNKSFQSQKPLTTTKTTTRHLSLHGDNVNGIPTTTTATTTTTTGTTPSSPPPLSTATTTTADAGVTSYRVALNRIFNGEREYLFTTRRNVRSFEWRTDEAEDIFESLLDLGDGGASSDTLELNAITIIKAEMNDEERFRLAGQIYDVHDGQQRLVSLCLFLAALRDFLVTLGPEYYEGAEDVAKTIDPPKYRKTPTVRIQVREKSGAFLKSILVNRLRAKEGDGDELVLPDATARRLLSDPEKCMLEVYEYFLKRIEEIGGDEALRMYDNLLLKTFVLISIPTDTKTARSIIMSLGKGKNLEPVDEFKGMVCFNCIKQESAQDATFDKWSDLCHDVGRPVMETTCLIHAQRFLKKMPARNGEIDIMEDFLRKSGCISEGRGARLFEEMIPTAKLLSRLRHGLYPHQEMSIGSGGRKVTTASRDVPSIGFLCGAAQIQTTKCIEMVVVDLLQEMESGHNGDYIKNQRRTKEDVLKDMKRLESIALWILLAKPKPKQRYNRCFDIMSYKNKHGRDDDTVDPLELTHDENALILENLTNGDFGSTTARTKTAKLILERLNEFLLLDQYQGRVQPLPSKLQLEHVLPRKYHSVTLWNDAWDSENASSWMHRLGNLALLNQKMNGKISNGCFESKRDFLGASPYPLTNRISKKFDLWDVAAVEENHEYLISLAREVWDLG